MKTSKTIQGNVVSAVGNIGQYLPSADIFSFLSNLVEAFRDNQQNQRDLAEIGAKRDLLIAEVTRRYELYEAVFDKIFAERKGAVDRYFALVDRGIKTDNKELILSGLQGVSAIVCSSPFTNIQELAKLMESGQRIEV